MRTSRTFKGFIAFFFLCIFTLSSANASSAFSCDIGKVLFGSSISDVMNQYKLKAVNIRKDGDFTIPQMGIKLCDKLPKQSLVQFIFIDDTFVQLRIDNENNGGALKEYAIGIFGKSDDDDRKDSADKNSDMALWNKNQDKSIIYSAFEDGRGAKEMLEVTSKNYKSLFDKQVKQMENDR